MAKSITPSKILIPADKVAAIIARDAETENGIPNAMKMFEDSRNKTKTKSEIEIIPPKGEELSNFDWQMLTAAIAQQQAGNTHTSAAILYATIGGDAKHITPSKKKEILQSVKKLMFTKFQYKLNQNTLKKKTKWQDKNGKKIVEYGLESYLLPAKIVEEKINGQLTRDAIQFLEPSPIVDIVEFKNQFEKINAELMKVPKLNCTTATVNLRFELVNLIVRLRRMNKRKLRAAKRQGKFSQVTTYLQINLANLYKRCGLSLAVNRQGEYRSYIEKIMSHFQTLGFVKEWHFGKSGRAFTHICFI